MPSDSATSGSVGGISVNDLIRCSFDAGTCRLPGRWYRLLRRIFYSRPFVRSRISFGLFHHDLEVDSGDLIIVLPDHAVIHIIIRVVKERDPVAVHSAYFDILRER